MVRMQVVLAISISSLLFFFFFNATATTEIYTLSLHDALPISDWGFFAARSASEQVSLPILDALRPLHSHQAVPHHVQIGERTGDEQPIRVFRNTAIAHLGEAKDSLDDADGVLDPGTHARARPIDHALTRLEVLVAAPALLSEVFRRGSKSLVFLSTPTWPFIPKNHWLPFFV